MASSDHDLPLKLKVAASFRRMGYIAFTEVDLCTYTYRESYKRKQVTDFDVLGIRVDPDLEAFIAVAECKSVEVRAMENLLKLHGVQEFFNAHKAYFVQQGIDVNAREVGAQLGITCLDASNIDTLLKSLSLSEQDVALEGEVYTARIGMLPAQKKDFARQTEYLKYDFWTLPDHRNIINLIRLMGLMAKGVNPAKKDHVVLCYQLATALALSIIRMAGGIVRHNIDDFQESLLTALLGGSRERRDREVMYDTIAQAVPDASLSFVPEFFEQLSELTSRYLSAMTYSHRIIACLDEMGRHIVLDKKSKDLNKIADHFHEKTIKFARDALYFSCNACGVPKEVFSSSLTDDMVHPT